jgi:hypothetical protein
MDFTADDYVAIQQLYLRYSVAIDLHELDDYVACYTEDGEYVGFREGGTPYAKGHAALRAFAEANAQQTREEYGYHFNTAPLIDPTDDGARGRCYLIYVVARPDGTVGEIRYALYYRDELVKRDGRWLFRKRNTTALPEGRLPRP